MLVSTSTKVEPEVPRALRELENAVLLPPRQRHTGIPHRNGHA